MHLYLLRMPLFEFLQSCPKEHGPGGCPCPVRGCTMLDASRQSLVVSRLYVVRMASSRRRPKYQQSEENFGNLHKTLMQILLLRHDAR